MVLRREVAPLVLAAALLAAVALADVRTGEETVFVSLLITPPLLVAAFTRPHVTLAVGLVATALAVTLVPQGGAGGTNAVRVVAIVSASALAVLIAWQREEREGRLVQMTVVADVAQNAVLWPVPARLADLSLAARYISASTAARIGGDLFEAVETEHGVRLIVGDVRGKGLPAVRLASAVLGCFREVAHTRDDLTGVREALDATVRRLAQPEDFVTAVLVQVTDEEACVLAAGHPAPLLVHDGQVCELDAGTVALPLGFGDHTTDGRRFDLPPGARLLLYTDGLIEARDPGGRFYPVLQQADVLSGPDLEACLDELLRRLHEHCGGDVGDDVALMLVQRNPVTAPTASADPSAAAQTR